MLNLFKKTIFLLLLLLSLGCISYPLPGVSLPTVTPSIQASPFEPVVETAWANQNVTSVPKPTDKVLSTPSQPPNIILVIVDALRADHLSAYGYTRQTTPTLDALVAAQGARFSDATTTAPWTFPGNSAVLTGLTPTTLGVTWTSQSIPSGTDTLTELLKAGGYYTTGFVSAYYVKSRFGFSQGFNHWDETLANRTTANKGKAEEVNTLALSWLNNVWAGSPESQQPLFLLLYYYDPHTWYDPPPPYDILYDSTYTGTLTADVFQEGRDIIEGNIVPTARDIEHILALYDGEIRYWDDRFAEMLEALDDLGITQNSLLIVTADHGESFGEKGMWGHGSSLYEEQLRVPLVMRYPGVITAGQVVTSPVQTIDITPTSLDFAGLQIPAGLQGQSLKTLATGGSPSQNSTSRAVYSELDGITDPNHPLFWLAPHLDLRSARRDGWKLIHTFGNQAPGELYQIAPGSPYETQNQAANMPVLATELSDALHVWFNFQDIKQFLSLVLR